jgi:hypothetical protein
MLTPVSNSSAASRPLRLDLVEPRPQPVKAKIDGDRLAARQLAHRPGIAVSPRHGLGDAETGRSALVGWIVDKSALAIDQGVDQPVHIHHFVHAVAPSSRNFHNQIGDV